MADYFLVHDRIIFEEHLRPALAAAWRERSFAPCVSLCRDLSPVARDQAARWHISTDDLLLFQVEPGLLFDRAFWRTLVGELLLFAARESPEFPARLDTLTHLLARSLSAESLPREQLPPIHQALQGSRDLTFGAVVYRPEHAGYNDAAAVIRLAEYLASVRPEDWTTGDLAPASHLRDEEDLEDELAFAREWFAELRELYSRAAGNGQVLVLERIF
jgi:hypothetical protein